LLLFEREHYPGSHTTVSGPRVDHQGDLMEIQEQAQVEAWLAGLSDADLAVLANDKAIWSSRAMAPPDAPCMVPQREFMALVQAEIDRRSGGQTRTVSRLLFVGALATALAAAFGAVILLGGLHLKKLFGTDERP
jgi:hypothetical protein